MFGRVKLEALLLSCSIIAQSRTQGILIIAGTPRTGTPRTSR